MLRNRKTSGPPLLLRDMHEGPWGTEPRGIKPGAAYTEVTPMATVRDWCWIPESDLPESWSCVWIRCFWYWISAQNEFYRTYTFPNPHPIMFHSGEGETVLLESAGRFYLYGLPEYAELYQFYSDTLCPSLLFPQVPAWSPYVHDTNRCLLYQFDGVYSSVADFLEHADWTRMSLVAPKPLESPPTAGSSHLESIKAPMLPMTDYGGPLRIAANTHVRKRTLWDTYRPPGTWGFAPRYTHNSDVKKVWDRSQHSVLPAPWAWFNPQNTPSQRNVSELQRFWFTPALTPVMFRCPELPGASNQMTVYSSHGKYYLEDEDLGSRLWEFQGTYASVDDFIDNADWNKLDPMENEEDKEYYEYWPEERKRDVGR
ncbi:hypothetical protein DFH06DRAFT_1206842 [Mycena polygramma]|nr:hypothetical protein DFH06DRAFT_1206842 [Mycena polygramma]